MPRWHDHRVTTEPRVSTKKRASSLVPRFLRFISSLFSILSDPDVSNPDFSSATLPAERTPMATVKQIAANRANARKSTGPRTPEAKAAASRNALKTGIYAPGSIIRHESAEMLKQ